MKSELPIIGLVLTYNEEIHIERCLLSLKKIVDRIVVVDSKSDDKTIETASRYADKIISIDFTTHCNAVRLGLEHILAMYGESWVFRLDADEYLMGDLGKSDLSLLAKDKYLGVSFLRYQTFFGRVIRNGGASPNDVVRLVKIPECEVDDRVMDEHFTCDKAILCKKIWLIDDNKKGVRFWIMKHQKYSDLETAQYFIDSDSNRRVDSKKNSFKRNAYYSLPIFIRPFLYFFYRYLFLFGFLDGRPGLVFHLFQGLWYRLLVDFKIFSVKFCINSLSMEKEEAMREIIGLNFDKLRSRKND